MTVPGIVLSHPIRLSSWHEAVQRIPSGHELNRIGDDLPADQRGPHPLRAHADAIRNRDGVELYGGPASRPYASLHLLRDAAEVGVAGHHLDPRVGDTDQGFA